MTPQFTTPCFVRVEDAGKRKEVYEKLEEIDRSLFRTVESEYIFCFNNFAREGVASSLYGKGLRGTDGKAELERGEVADCGTNIDLFLALAGMRSDTDKGQWFKKGSLMIKADQSGNISIPLVHYFKSIPVTRATAAEIIEHFKTK